MRTFSVERPISKLVAKVGDEGSKAAIIGGQRLHFSTEGEE